VGGAIHGKVSVAAFFDRSDADGIGRPHRDLADSHLLLSPLVVWGAHRELDGLSDVRGADGARPFHRNLGRALSCERAASLDRHDTDDDECDAHPDPMDGGVALHCHTRPAARLARRWAVLRNLI